MMTISIANGLLMALFNYVVACSGLNHVGTVTPIEVQQFFCKGTTHEQMSQSLNTLVQA
jgi:hypothetical protein